MVDSGNRQAANDLLCEVYTELRRLAQKKMLREPKDQTLQPTALVHEAFLRLVDGEHPTAFQNRGHFYAAAAEAMRRILIENARRRKSKKHGGTLQRHELGDFESTDDKNTVDNLLDLDVALQKLESIEPELAKLVKLRYFVGMTIEETARTLDVSPRTVTRDWAFARAWLGRELNEPKQTGLV